jgi:general secretion pathway protein A
MYNEFFSLRENPFNVNPDPRYLFLTPQTREALDGLTHGIKTRKGLLLLTGEVGTGKTTLLNHLLDWLHQQHTPTAFIFNSHLEVSHLFDFVLADFAVKFDSRLKDNALLRLQQWLLERYRAGQTPVVIVDEAQGLPDHVLEEIRMLLNLETCNEKLLQVVLAGQPELEDRLQQPALRQVKQRIALRCKTAALSLEEAHQYIQARLHIAGAGGARIFASEAMDAAHFYSRGIPRVMNLLCEHALLNASVEQVQPVPEHFVAEVAREFQFDDIKPVTSSFRSVGAQQPDPISVQSRFMNALVSLNATAEPVLQEYPGPSAIREPVWSAPEENVFSAVKEPAAPVLHWANFPDDETDAATSIRSTAPPTPRVAPWQTELQTKLLSDWTAFYVEVHSSLASEPAVELALQPQAERAPQPGMQPAAPTHSPRPYLVEAKPASGHSVAATRSQLPTAQAFSPASLKSGAAKSVFLRLSTMKVAALRLVLVRWTMKWSDSFFTTAATTAWAPPPAILLQLPARWLHQMKSWCGDSLARGEEFVAAIASIDWPQLKITTARWLRQPCDPTQWRPLDFRLFEEMFRFNHKKM